MRARALSALPLLSTAALALAILALARPQTSGSRTRDLSVEGIDIVIALDLSTSMEAGDFRSLGGGGNRISVAKETLSDFISSRVNDRIGLVVFAGAAYTQAPLTLDYGVLKEVVKQLRTRVIEDGTAIGDAIAVSLNRLRDSDAKSKVIVLITDGDNNAGKISPLDAAAMAKSLHIPVFTVLVGKGGRVPFPDGTDLFGNPTYREMDIAINPELLEGHLRRDGRAVLPRHRPGVPAERPALGPGPAGQEQAPRGRGHGQHARGVPALPPGGLPLGRARASVAPQLAPGVPVSENPLRFGFLGYPLGLAHPGYLLLGAGRGRPRRVGAALRAQAEGARRDALRRAAGDRFSLPA